MSHADRRAYATLDGLRGVAALLVVTRHIGAILPDDPFPESFLAVDLFFLLSGFVIAHAYEGRLLAGPARGMSLPAFLRVRLIRLYPLYVLGLALGALAILAQGWTGGGGAAAGWLVKAGVVGLLMLPALPPLPMGASALDGPTWTLLPELLANLVYAAGVRRLGARSLAAIVGCGAVGLVLSQAHYHTLDGGWSVDRLPLIAARLGFSFFLGVAMFRLRPTRRVGAPAAWACLAIVAAALVLQPHGALRQLYELAVVMAVFPAVVWVAVHREPGPLGARAFGALGLASYAIYVLHAPLGSLTGSALAAARIPVRGPLVAMVFVVAAGLLCLVVDRVYDTPVRRWLSGRGRRRTPPYAPPAAPVGPSRSPAP